VKNKAKTHNGLKGKRDSRLRERRGRGMNMSKKQKSGDETGIDLIAFNRSQ